MRRRHHYLINLSIVAIVLFVAGCDTSPTEIQVDVILPDDDPGDSTFTVGDGSCNRDAGENGTNSPSDCPCGNGTCADNESFDSCPADCAEPNPFIVVAAGRCVGLAPAAGATNGAIQCTEESECILDGVIKTCRSVEWDATDIDSGVSVGSSTGTPEEVWQLPGAPPGAYQVRQRVFATDGERDDKVHNVTVPQPPPSVVTRGQ